MDWTQRWHLYELQHPDVASTPGAAEERRAGSTSAVAETRAQDRSVPSPRSAETYSPLGDPRRA
jgi:hypothetical protein